MIYKERKIKYISAFKIPGEIPSCIEYIKPEKIEGVDLEALPKCDQCGKSIKEHLIINNGSTIICPDSYVIYEGSTIINVMSSENFEQLYEALGEVVYESN